MMREDRTVLSRHLFVRQFARSFRASQEKRRQKRRRCVTKRHKAARSPYIRSFSCGRQAAESSCLVFANQWQGCRGMLHKTTLGTWPRAGKLSHNTCALTANPASSFDVRGCPPSPLELTCQHVYRGHPDWGCLESIVSSPQSWDFEKDDSQLRSHSRSKAGTEADSTRARTEHQLIVLDI